MPKTEEKRNSIHETAHQPSPNEGVGARQTLPLPPSGGGGYQDKCTDLNFFPGTNAKKNDPRIEEMRKMGLHVVWISVAEKIGFDAMLNIWQILDKDKSLTDNGRILVPLRSYSTYLRFQRNRYIESLSRMGLKPPAIKQIISEQMGEQISIRHISRLSKIE